MIMWKWCLCLTLDGKKESITLILSYYQGVLRLKNITEKLKTCRIILTSSNTHFSIVTFSVFMAVFLESFRQIYQAGIQHLSKFCFWKPALLVRYKSKSYKALWKFRRLPPTGCHRRLYISTVISELSDSLNSAFMLFKTCWISSVSRYEMQR